MVARLSTLLLIGGFLAFAGAVVSAAVSPPQGYELSIYASTPLAFWLGLGVAVGAATVAAVTTAGRRRGLAIVLAGGSMFALVALPFVRGYFFYGIADPLTHLGWTRRLLAGAIGPRDLIYPGVHTFAAYFAALAGIPPRRALLFATAVFPVAFVGFVGLTVRALVPGRHALVVGAFSAILLLPINHLDTHLRTHPYSLATLYAALVVFALTIYVTRGRREGRPSLVTAEGALLVLAASASILYHPLLASDLLVLLVALVAVQLLAGRIGRIGAFEGHPSLLAPTVVFGGAFLGWIYQAPWFDRAAGLFGDALVGALLGESVLVGDRIASQSTSLAAIGSGPLELFVKLFVPTTVFLLFAGGYVVALATRRLDATADERDLAGSYFTMAALVAGTIVVIWFVSSLAEMYLRHFGFLMVFVTVLGALALVHVLAAPLGAIPALALDRPGHTPIEHRSDGGTRRGPRGGRAAASVVVIVLGAVALIALAGAVAFPSPYIYQANQQVTASEFAAYEWTFAEAPTDVQVAGIRATPTRFQDAIRGPGRATQVTPAVNATELASLSAALPPGGVFVLSERDIQRETDAYRGLRFDEAAFAAVETQPGVNRVYANGDTTVYVVAG